jgi:hypothetical protein
LTVGEKVTVAYRGKKLVRTTRSNFLSPSHGIGFGLGETGIVLNRILNTERKNTTPRIVREVTGTVIEETPDYVTLEQANGKRLKIRVTDVVRRTTIHERF